MMTSEDIARVKRGPADLEERIEQLEKQKELLKTACKKAGETIKSLTKRAQEAEGEVTIVKGIGMNSPEMRAAKAEIEEVKADLAREKEDRQYDNLVHRQELERLLKLDGSER